VEGRAVNEPAAQPQDQAIARESEDAEEQNCDVHDVDVAFPLRPSQRPGLTDEVIARDTFIVLVREDDPRCGPLPITAFANDRFLLFPRHSAPGLRALIDQLFRDAAVEPVATELSELTVGLETLVAAGAGVFVGPAGNYRSTIPGVRAIELTAGRHPVLSMAVRTGTHSEILRNFMNVVRGMRDRENWLA
jgi:DNA-binding transcriptional LysR family regulator